MINFSRYGEKPFMKQRRDVPKGLERLEDETDFSLICELAGPRAFLSAKVNPKTAGS